MYPEMFTKEEAITFVQNSWRVENVEKRMESDRKNLLDEVICCIQANVPFQSITLMASPQDVPQRPSQEDIKKNCMAEVGGLCYAINWFTWCLLKALGFSTQVCLATVSSTVTSPDNHLLVLVTDLEKRGDLYLVDCGIGLPIFRAVPLNFDQESPVYQAGFLEFKFVHHDGKILRMHGKGDMIKPNNPPIEGLDFFLGRWRRFYSFVPEPLDLTVDGDRMYSSAAQLTYFPKSPRAMRFPDKRAVIMVNNRMILETDDGNLETTVLESDDEIVKGYAKYFPAIEEDIVRRAIAKWRSLSM